MPIIDSFDVHYSKICWKLQERYICRFVCLYWVHFDRVVRCSATSWNVFKYFRNISWNISGQKNSWNFTSLMVMALHHGQQRSENMKASKRQIEGYKGATVLRSRPQYNCFLTLKLQKCGGASRISTYRFEETHVCYENTYSYIIISICCLRKKHRFLKLCSFGLKWVAFE